MEQPKARFNNPSGVLVAISETEVAILVPVRNGERFIARALVSALKTGAGEIIVSNNCSDDRTLQILTNYSDPRLTVVDQPEMLGLWEHHLALLRCTVKPWIKFLHADDELAVGGLGVMVRHADDKVAVVGVIPVLRNGTSGHTWSTFTLEAPKRWNSAAYLKRLLTVGNELGTPSHVLFRRTALELDPSSWRSEISADLVANVMAATKGDVVLLPSGPVVSEIHEAQDTRRQGLTSMVRRLRNSVALLAMTRRLPVQQFAAIFGFVEAIGAVRTFFGAARRGATIPREAIAELVGCFGAIEWLRVMTALPAVARMLRWKYWRREGRRL